MHSTVNSPCPGAFWRALRPGTVYDADDGSLDSYRKKLMAGCKNRAKDVELSRFHGKYWREASMENASQVGGSVALALASCGSVVNFPATAVATQIGCIPTVYCCFAFGTLA